MGRLDGAGRLMRSVGRIAITCCSYRSPSGKPRFGVMVRSQVQLGTERSRESHAGDLPGWNSGRVSRKLRSMKPVTGYHLINPKDLQWRPSNLMKIPNADFLERTGSENLSARLWRLPSGSASTLHKHVRQEEFYFVLEGMGRIRVGGETLSVPKHGGLLVGPEQLRQVFNDTDTETLWLIIGAPEELEFLQGSKSQMDLSLIYPEDPTQLPPELEGVHWPR